VIDDKKFTTSQMSLFGLGWLGPDRNHFGRRIIPVFSLLTWPAVRAGNSILMSFKMFHAAIQH
jgi:hypothetical protein